MLARFERMMEQAVEGSLRRVFPTRLQPVQLAKAAARAMEEAQVVGVHGTEVPNVYAIRVSPDDLARFAEYSGTLSQELGRYLADYARERGLRPVGPPRVELSEDASVPVGAVRAAARFVDLEPRRQAALEDALEGTRRLRLGVPAASAGPSPVPEAPLRLTDRLGLDYPLDPSAAVVRVGRAADNDVAIPNQRVSRYHAQLRWTHAGWLVSDLDSTNGTYVDDERVEPAEPRPVGPGSVLRLADHNLAVQSS
jgi:Protein of unknown function (DUF3662)/FHA domain